MGFRNLGKTRTTLLGKEEPFNWRPWGACWGGRETRCEAKKTLVVVVSSYYDSLVWGNLYEPSSIAIYIYSIYKL